MPRADPDKAKMAMAEIAYNFAKANLWIEGGIRNTGRPACWPREFQKKEFHELSNRNKQRLAKWASQFLSEPDRSHGERGIKISGTKWRPEPMLEILRREILRHEAKEQRIKVEALRQAGWIRKHDPSNSRDRKRWKEVEKILISVFEKEFLGTERRTLNVKF